MPIPIIISDVVLSPDQEKKLRAAAKRLGGFLREEAEALQHPGCPFVERRTHDLERELKIFRLDFYFENRLPSDLEDGIFDELRRQVALARKGHDFLKDPACGLVGGVLQLNVRECLRFARADYSFLDPEGQRTNVEMCREIYWLGRACFLHGARDYYERLIADPAQGSLQREKLIEHLRELAHASYKDIDRSGEQTDDEVKATIKKLCGHRFDNASESRVAPAPEQERPRFEKKRVAEMRREL